LLLRFSGNSKKLNSLLGPTAGEIKLGVPLPEGIASLGNEKSNAL